MKTPLLKCKYLTQKYPNVNPDFIDQMEQADPAKGKSLEWMVRRLNNSLIRWPEDRQRLVTALTSFYKIKRSPTLLKQYSASPDLNHYTIHQLEELSDKIEGVTQRPDSVNLSSPGLKKIYDNGVYAVFKILNSETAVEMAKGTKWCTSDFQTAKHYIENSGLYIWFKEGKKFAQSDGESQFMDLQDATIVPDIELLKLYKGLFKNVPTKLPPEFKKELDFETLEIIKDIPDVALEYSCTVLKRRWPEAEPYIMKDPYVSVSYARDIIKGRWPEAEPYIKYDCSASLLYARDVIKGRWPEAEPLLVKATYYAYGYAHDVIEGRWPEAEPLLSKDLEKGFSYALNVIKGRWPEAEPYIMKDPCTAYDYALHIIKGRWPEAEPFIMKDPTLAVFYTRDIIKGRWPEAEPFIKLDLGLWGKYEALWKS